MEDKLKEAIRVYNKIAKIYSEKNYSKLLQFQLLRFGSLLKGKKVLDAGCGPGRDVEYLMSEGYDVVGIDLSEGMIEEAKKNVPNGNFMIMDFRKMKFKDKSFDGIWSMASLVHMDKNQVVKSLKEFNRILSDKGILYIAVKEGEGEADVVTSYYKEPRHYCFYKEEDMKKCLEDSGFIIIDSSVTSTEEGEKWLEIFTRKST